MVKKSNQIILICLAFIFYGCASFPGFLENKTWVEVSARQAVYAYIVDAGSSVGQHERAVKLHNKLKIAVEYMEGNPEASVKNLEIIALQHLNFDALTPYEKIMLMDLIAIIKANILQNETDGFLSEGTVVRLKSLLETARATAEALQ